jgi:hypothetical protein
MTGRPVRELMQQPIPAFICPSDPNPNAPLNTNRPYLALGPAPPYSLAISNYPASPQVLENDKWNKFADIFDGTANTIMVGERSTKSPIKDRIPPAGDPRLHSPNCDDLYAGLIFGYSGQDVDSSNNRDNCNNAFMANGAFRMQDGYMGPVAGVTFTYIVTVAWGSMHPGGANHALCDGAVRFISETLSWTPITVPAGTPKGTYNRLYERADKLPVGDF